MIAINTHSVIIRRFVSVLLGLSVLFLSHKAKAQLSGSYTVGSSGATYSTISAAIADLNTKGINAPVVFKVSAGTYNETLTLGSVSGASAKNTILFLGAGRGKSIIQDTGKVVSFIKNCSYISFSQFTISNTGTNEAVSAGYCSNCAILNCDLAASNSGNIAVINDVYTIYFNVSNCHISGGYFGVDITSANGSSIYANASYLNNRLVNFSYYALYANSSNYNIYNGNVIDSSANGLGYGFVSIYETGAVYTDNQVIAPKLYYPILVESGNYYSAKTAFIVANNFFSNFSQYAYFYLLYSSNILIAHNTIYGNSGSNALFMYLYYCNADINLVSNIVFGGGSNPTTYINCIGSTFPAPFGEMDGNAYVNPNGGPVMYLNGTTYNSVASYQNAVSGYVYTSPYNGSKYPFETFSTNFIPSFVNAPVDLHISQTAPAPLGVYAGINVDIDGKTRCKLFPTAGAVESTLNNGAPVSKFTLPSPVYPGSPTFVYQTATAKDHQSSHWYLNGVHISDSMTLKTNAFVKGNNCLKLVSVSCSGIDSSTQCVTVSAPSSAPGSDFISDLNSIQSGQVVSFEDLSTNGPTQWQWTVSPDSVLTGGVLQPTIQYIYGTSNSQNPKIRFTSGGKYTVCLTASNSAGKGNTNCKSNYISVVTSVNLSGVPAVIGSASGYLYDNGGPNGNYTFDPGNGYVETALIDPCADSVFLTFSQFDLYCGYDFLRIYEGRDNNGKSLWSSKCNSTGISNLGPGYTGGKAFTCSYQCMPDVSKPDTFKAKSTMYIEMVCYAAYQSAGFKAQWWSTPKKATKPVASFTTSNAGDSVCMNGTLYFTNTTTTNADDPATCLWDLDGSIADGFECTGACLTSLWPYFQTGQLTVTLIATNCGGSDTAQRIIHVFTPPKPKSAFSANNTSPTTNDIIYLTSDVVQCVDDYQWTIAKSSNGSSKAVSFVNGTTNQFENPEINISDTGYFSVSLQVSNVSGSNPLNKSKYIYVRNPYCIPSVTTLLPGIGISKVVFAGINDSSAQASQDYINFSNSYGISASVAQGATYTLSVSRDTSLIFDPINRDVYIDWNQDGSFVGAGEIVAQDSNSSSPTYTKTITVPKTAKLGATVMRIATNLNLYSNKPCGTNEFGEYQDYRVYITSYNVAPVIMLSGKQGLKDTIYLQQGFHFTEPGYTAYSLLYGNMTKKTIRSSKQLNNTHNDTFNYLIPGVYIFSYNVTDSAGNKAITQYRVVKITPDVTPPALIVAGPDTTFVEVNSKHHTLVPKVISAYDLVDGDLSSVVAIDSTFLQTSTVGVYTISYTVADISGNDTVLYRYIDVIDTARPVLTLAGPSLQLMEVYTSYIDPGVNITDVYYSQAQLLPYVKAINDIDTAKLGFYGVTYTLTDPSKNVAFPVQRIVRVVDTMRPWLKLIGPAVMTIPVLKNFADPGVQDSDNYDAKPDITVSKGGVFYFNFPSGFTTDTGRYTIVYTATDKSGNKATISRIVLVHDTTNPLITLRGEITVNLCRWQNYKDSGYVISDKFDPANTVKVDTLGSFYQHGGTSGATTVLVTYNIWYRATDKAGNTAESEKRLVNVYPADDPRCSSGINPGISLDKLISIFPNPNQGIFTVNSNIEKGSQVRIVVTNELGQLIELVYDGALNDNDIRIDLSAHAAGIYFVNIIADNQSVTRRVDITK